MQLTTSHGLFYVMYYVPDSCRDVKSYPCQIVNHIISHPTLPQQTCCRTHRPVRSTYRVLFRHKHTRFTIRHGTNNGCRRWTMNSIVNVWTKEGLCSTIYESRTGWTRWPDHKKAECWHKAPHLLSVLVLSESDLVSFHGWEGVFSQFRSCVDLAISFTGCINIKICVEYARRIDYHSINKITKSHQHQHESIKQTW